MIKNDNGADSPAPANVADLIYDYRHEVTTGVITGSAERLLKRFDNFVLKYYLALTGKYKASGNKDLIEFCKLFGRKPLSKISEQLLKHYEDEDVLTEVQLALFETALSYDNIYINYKYELKKRLDYLLNDPLVSSSDEYEEHKHDKVDDSGQPNVTGIMYEVCGNGDLLNDFEKKVIKFKYIDDLGIKEISRRLHTSQSIIVKTIKRARELLDKVKGY